MALVTLFTDASHRPSLRSAGWGAWAAGEGRPPQTFSGPLPFTGASVTAELLAVAEAVRAVDRSYLADADEALMVQSDCVAALSALLAHVPGSRHKPHPDGVAEVHPRTKRLSPIERDAVEGVAYVLGLRGMRLVLRHVRGHSPDGGGRGWANRECDRLANIAAEAAAGLRAPHGSQT